MKNMISQTTVKKKKYGLLVDIKKNPASYLLALPALVYVIVFSYMTYPYMIIAFQKFNFRTGIFGSEFVGFQNFEFFFKSSDALRVISNTLFLNILSIFFGTLAALTLALLLNELRSKWYLRVSQSMMLLPHYLSWVIVSYVLYSLFSTDYGVFDQILRALGKQPINWYSEAGTWPAILTLMRVWKSMGMNAVIYLAAITGIDASQYEAAAIDGANRWQQCKYITIPLIMPTVIILTLLSIGKIMYGDFGMIYALVGDNGVLYPTTDIIDTYIYRVFRLTGNPSQAMAVGLFQSVIGFFMVFGSNRLAKKFFPEGAIY